MAKTINKVELLGRVGAEPEDALHEQGGTAVTQLRLATDRVRRGTARTSHGLAQRRGVGKAGRWRWRSTWRKGQRLYVAGRLVQKSWEGDDGQRRYRTEIHAQDVVFLDSARNGNGNDGNGNR